MGCDTHIASDLPDGFAATCVRQPEAEAAPPASRADAGTLASITARPGVIKKLKTRRRSQGRTNVL